MLTSVNSINPEIMFAIDETELLKCEYSSTDTRFRYYHPQLEYDVIWQVTIVANTRYYDRIAYRWGLPVSHLKWEY